MGDIKPIIMPKWGLSMSEGMLNAWLVEEGARIEVGQEILEVETDKIAGAMEATDAGLLRRRVAEEGTVYPVKALLGVLAEQSVDDAEIDAFIENFVVAEAETADADEAEAGAPQVTEIAGLRTRYAQLGAGPPDVILLHGFGGDLENWLFNLQALAESARVFALDLPGHGQSSRQLPGTGLDDLAGFVAAFMDGLNIVSAHFVGHSMGGAVALRLALMQPQRVDSLSLIASAGLGPEINDGYLGGFVAADSRRSLKPVVQMLFADPQLVTRQLLDDLLRFKRMDGAREALESLRESLFAGGVQQSLPGVELGALDLPVQVIWGEQDQVIPVAHCDGLPDNVQVHRLGSAGHMVQMEQANEVNRLLKAIIG